MTTLSITPHTTAQTAVYRPSVVDLATIGDVANQAASMAVFTDYLSRKSDNTLRTQGAALNNFSEFLALAGLDCPPTAEQLQTDPSAWQGVTWGIVEAFVKWMLGEGYSVATINNRLSTVKTYCALATKAGQLPPDGLTLIRAVSGYSGVEARRVDERRDQTRVGHKKAGHTPLTPEQAVALKSTGDKTPQGRRDRLLMCLLLDHGLRVGEVAGLAVSNFDLKNGKLKFYRPKVDKTQTHRLTDDTKAAAAAYLRNDALAIGPLFLASRKDGRLTNSPMTARSLTRRVARLGREVGVEPLSAHDCRHFWATHWSSRVNIIRLQEAGGWSSLAMPRRYTEWAKIANEGMI